LKVTPDPHPVVSETFQTPAERGVCAAIAWQRVI
jgi:hypothetical protein